MGGRPWGTGSLRCLVLEPTPQKWDVKLLWLRKTKQEIVLMHVKQCSLVHGIDILSKLRPALSETALYDSGVTELDDYTIIHSGSQNSVKAAHGVAICLDKSAARLWKSSGWIWEAVSSRIVMVMLKCKPINITIIAVYAPVNPSNGLKADVDASDNFYRSLQDARDK
ncbi:unnamed protein product, partial [Didymodactylos carnosus]